MNLRRGHLRSSRGFTIVELIIVVVVVSILAAITVVAYNGIRVAAMRSVALSDLRDINQVMQIERQETGTYPEELPESVRESGNGAVELIVSWSGTFHRYENLTAVQNGVLLSQICADLVAEGVGQGVNQGGQTQSYITGCGNWNRGSMQITGWNSRVWNTPVSSEQLLNYANNFTTSDTWNASHATVVRAFHNELVERHLSLGGSFPVTSFWDSWATPQNGGVQYQPLGTPVDSISYCVEARADNNPSLVWHVGDDGHIKEGPCEA